MSRGKLWRPESLGMEAQLGNLGVSFNRDFERRMKGALELDRLFLCGISVRGT